MSLLAPLSAAMHVRRVLASTALIACWSHAVTAKPTGTAPADVPPIIDATQWFSNRGINDAGERFASSEGCVEATVGKAHESALICWEYVEVSRSFGGDEPAHRLIGHRIVRVVRDHAVISVLDAETRLQVTDNPTPSSPPMLELTMDLAADGMTATVVDRGPGPKCTQALAGSARKLRKGSDAAGNAWAKFDREQQTRLCNARGTYRWKADRFQRSR